MTLSDQDGQLFIRIHIWVEKKGRYTLYKCNDNEMAKRK